MHRLPIVPSKHTVNEDVYYLVGDLNDENNTEKKIRTGKPLAKSLFKQTKSLFPNCDV